VIIWLGFQFVYEEEMVMKIFNDASSAERKERLRKYRNWSAKIIFGNFAWNKMDEDKKKSRIYRDLIVLSMAAISVLIYWSCFLDKEIPEMISISIFLFYLVPVSIVSVLYGWTGGILCFTPIFIAAIIMLPSFSYFPFFHLVAVYTYSFIYSRKLCRRISGTILCGIITGIILSLHYYLIFVLITAESFSDITTVNLLLHIVNIIPQSVIMCLFIYWFTNKCDEGLKKKIGCYDADTIAFATKIRTGIKKGYRSVSGKIFSLFLLEACVMGIAAAFFSNSLIPRMLEQYHAEENNVDINNDVDINNSDTNNSDTNNGSSYRDMGGERDEAGVRRIFNAGDMTEAFETARENGPRKRFSFDDQGIAFDLKLIMMLLCAIHPIVLIANYIGQKLIAMPIVDITNTVSGFGDDIDRRIEVEHKLNELNIYSEDEIESLYDVIKGMVKELNSYIDEMNRERKLKEDLRVAQAASEAKSNFLSSVSHEIRTPINAVLGLDEMILRESSEENIRKYAVDIKNSGRTLLGLINDLLDFSKIEAGKMEIIPTEYELSSTINDLINMVKAKAEDKGLELNINVDSDTPHVLYGDEIRIKQCILNILNNAVKYTPEGSVSLEVFGKYVSEDEIELCVKVTDTGIGIKEEDLNKLFSPFERIEESRNRTIEGTGLGLSIVKQLLDMMGSKLDVSSIYGEGSAFSFVIVQKVINREPIGDFNDTYLKSIGSIEEYKVSFIAPDACILVVDDTPMNLNVVKGLLKQTLVQVDTATSGLQCLDKVKEKSYDIIFMDQRMPNMDGTETLKALREMNPDENKSFEAPVIVLTANVVADARERFMKEGFNDYLSKPIDAVKLEKMIANYLPDEKVKEPDLDASDNLAEESDKEFMDKLSQVEGIDVSAALSNCMNEEILKGAVHDFYVSLKTEPDKIENMWKSGDLRNYTILVHALKSSSRLIGALKVSELAAHLEEMGDKGKKDEIDKETPKLLKMYRDFYGKLSDVCDSLENENSVSEADRETIDQNGLMQAYGAIREAVEAFDFDTADEIIKMLKEYNIPKEESEKYIRICDLVTRLDRDALMEEL